MLDTNTGSDNVTADMYILGIACFLWLLYLTVHWQMCFCKARPCMSYHQRKLDIVCALVGKSCLNI